MRDHRPGRRRIGWLRVAIEYIRRQRDVPRWVGVAGIVSVEIVNPIVWKEFEADKLSILDILAIDNADRRLNVEVQRTKSSWLPQRLTYYSATQLVDQIGEGDSYRKLRPSIGICILNSVHFS